MSRSPSAGSVSSALAVARSRSIVSWMNSSASCESLITNPGHRPQLHGPSPSQTSQLSACSFLGSLICSLSS
mgnify:CR=1 FL=1